MKLWITAALLAAVPTLNACNEVADDPVSMLRNGDPRVCGQQDVQSTLTNLIITKMDGMDTWNGEPVSDEDIQKALSVATLSYSLTTAEATDKSISKVTCSTKGTLGYPGGSTELPLIYSVKPSIGGKDGEFVVQVEDLGKAKLMMLFIVADELRKMAEARAPKSEPAPPEPIENEAQPSDQPAEPETNLTTAIPDARD